MSRIPSWGCRKMHMYLYGLPKFTIQTDHKPLVPILNNKMMVDMSPRIQRMRMTLLRYTFTAEHVKGKSLVDADALSRAPTNEPTREDQIAEEQITAHVNAVIETMPATNTKLAEIKKLACTDTELQTLKTMIRKGWPQSKQQCPEECKPFFDSRHDITEIDDLLVKGSRIIIPRKMRPEILQLIHIGHQSIEKSKRRARQSCYWPGMNSQIENVVQKCSTCAKYATSKRKEPLLTPPLPMRAWQKIGTDLFTTHNETYIIITDYYSLWPELYQLKRTKTQDVIEVMKDVFARHGIPDEVYSDNGPQYKAKSFKDFSKEWGFIHTTSSPRYPQSNGLAEASVKILKRMINK